MFAPKEEVFEIVHPNRPTTTTTTTTAESLNKGIKSVIDTTSTEIVLSSAGGEGTVDDITTSVTSEVVPTATTTTTTSPTTTTIPPTTLVEDDNCKEEEEEEVTSEEEPYYLLCNRLLLCSVAVCLLWATSLQICMGIVGVNINVPLLSSVTESCEFALHKVNQQREQYKQCAEIQLLNCHKQLDRSYTAERSRVDATERQNELFRVQVDHIVANCTTSYQMAIQAINAWTAANPHPTKQELVPYYFSNCSVPHRSQVQSLIGTSSAAVTSKNTVIRQSEQYSKSVDDTVFRLVDYTDSLSAYNNEYIHNKTSRLKLLSEKILLDISAPRIASLGASFDPVRNLLDQLLACATLSDTNNYNNNNNNNNNQCPYEASFYDVYDKLSSATNARLQGISLVMQDIQETFNEYVEQVEDAIATANAFYDSVQGPQGLVMWVYDNTGITQLCGTTTPNFCTFSKVFIA